MAKFYVTTAIPYVNAEPHIGNAMDFIIADVLARYHRAKGADVIFNIGTDEHGGKNAEAAAKLGLEPKAYVDNLSQHVRDLATALDISFDRFLRTTDKHHEVGTQAIWKRMNPYIYKSTYKGMYDQVEEEFITIEVARKIKTADPERFSRLQEVEEDNYFFKLSEFTEPVKKAIKDGSFKIVPVGRKHEILAVLESGLQDISISRPKSKIPWGIPVPDDKDQTMYVWVDALLNYITTLAHPKPEDLQKYWPADVQVIGKNILRFHAAIWPAMLLAINLPLPKALLVHGFITLDNKKMSKSEGNVVRPLEIVKTYGSDATRYYFLRHIPTHEDGDFSWDKMLQAYNGELGNDLGNLVQRLASMINRYQNGVIGELPPAEHDVGPYEQAMADLRLDKALDHVFSLVRGINQYIDEQKPWEIAKKDAGHLQEVLAYASASLIQIGRLIEPFMPATGGVIQKTFGQGVVSGYDHPLFPRIEPPAAQ